MSGAECGAEGAGDHTEGGGSGVDIDQPKHQLQNAWTLWFYKNDKNKSWEDRYTPIVSFSTVEDFWAVYNHVENASGLQLGCDYALFKEGIKPMWEDTKNRCGGRWIFSVAKNSQNRNGQLDHLWIELMMSLVGEWFYDESDEVCGAVINRRKGADKVALWTTNADRRENNMKIAQILKDRLNIPKEILIGYECHKDSAVRTSSMIKTRHTL